MEVFKLLGKIAIEGAEAAKDTLGGLGSAAAKTGKVIAAGLAAGAAAVGAITKSAVDSYAEYEQLVGGIETMFEDLSWDIGEYAKQAYQTAGLSMNEYMETVMGFSASLNQSLLASEGNIARAADLANQTIIDMADNANKMGSSMESIQNAYQGFAKQNYTMLDNLKLGYGGTKEEMERLIADANKVKKANGEMGDLSISSFADVAEAIHIIQTEMGIAGTTAAEASSTIQGSLSATKSAWQNLLVGFADEGQDLGILIESLVNSATVAAGNLVPRIAKILAGVSDALALIMPVIAAELPSILEQLLPGLIDGALALTIGLIQALPVIVEVLAAQLPSILMQLFNALEAAFPVFINSCLSLLHTIVAPIAEFLHGLMTTIGKGISNGFKVAVNWVIDGINGFIRGMNKIKIPDWVPGIGGKGFTIKEIPRLEKGGVLEKGQTGFLEGNGAEAVVPLDQNRKWISAVADTMSATIGGGETAALLEAILEAIRDTNNLTEEMKTAFENWKMVINNREFARMVKAVG